MLGGVIKLITAKQTMRRKLNAARAYLEFFLRRSRLSAYPVKLTIDPANVCNLECKLCPSGSGKKGRSQGLMPFTTFKKIIDECAPYVWSIQLFNWGEPLLNRDIFKMVEYAKASGLEVCISSNLNHFDEEICRELMDSGLDKLIVSLHGASQESIDHYQSGADFDKTISAMRSIVEAKSREAAGTPFLQWRFIINKYNQGEVNEARKLADSIGVDRLELGRMRCDMADEIFLSPGEQADGLQQWELERDGAGEVTDARRRPCRFLWLEPSINPNGSVSPCCALWYEKYDFGNVNESSFKEIWNNELYVKARLISGGKPSGGGDEEHVCRICYEKGGLYF